MISLDLQKFYFISKILRGSSVDETNVSIWKKSKTSLLLWIEQFSHCKTKNNFNIHLFCEFFRRTWFLTSFCLIVQNTSFLTANNLIISFPNFFSIIVPQDERSSFSQKYYQDSWCTKVHACEFYKTVYSWKNFFSSFSKVSLKCWKESV